MCLHAALELLLIELVQLHSAQERQTALRVYNLIAMMNPHIALVQFQIAQV